jgi:O-antigen/teichoic acid export membrane protein
MRLKHVSFFVAEHASTRALDAILTLVLIRALDVGSLGAFVVYQSWVAILLLGFPALENMLYREHGRHKAAGTLTREIAVYRNFNKIKIFTGFLLTAICAAVPFGDISFSRRIAAMSLAFALPLAQMLYGLYRETLRFELKQESIVLISAAQRLTSIVAVYFTGVRFHGAIEPIALVALAIYLLFGFVWAGAARILLPNLKPVRLSFSESLPRIRKSLTETILWIHFTGAILGAVATLDVYFLSRSGISLGEIAFYSIALKAANFFQIIPVPFTQAFGVYLGRTAAEKNPKRERRIVCLGFAGLAVLGVFMLALGWPLSLPILKFLSKGKFSAEQLVHAVEYFRWMLGGVALLALCSAHGNYLLSRGNVKGLTLFVMLPWLGFSIVLYSVAAHLDPAPLWAARANVAVGGLYTLGYIGFFVASRKKA